MKLRDKVARVLLPCLERAHNEYQLADAAIATVQEAGWQDIIFDALNSAYQAGATDVHIAWRNGHGQSECDFGEAGSDYAREHIPLPPPPFEGTKHG